MSSSKCSLLKPVDNLTGNVFLFSQYTQDLTKQYANPDSYRCVPSKYVAMNLNWHGITGAETTQEEFDRELGNIFQNYFENSCAFLRSKFKEDNKDWDPEYTRTLLFQTLEKYNFIEVDRLRDKIMDISAVSDGSEAILYGVVSGISSNIQYIGDINIYSNEETEDGIGYNEIYCYLPNEAKCTDYRLSAVPRNPESIYSYTSPYICGYEKEASINDPMYNGLTGYVSPEKENGRSYIDSRTVSGSLQNCYGIGLYNDDLLSQTLVPSVLTDNISSDDKPRLDDSGKELEKFEVNTILLLYDIVSKTEDKSIYIAKNVPLGIYFTGRRVLDGTDTELTNTIVKYVDSGQIYNQGTSYGLRVCTRFFTMPNSTEKIEISATGSSNISEMAPVLEKMGETIAAAGSILSDKDNFYKLLNDHLAQFKNNKVNVPYVRTLGNKKYWFVNGKNTGAIAQYEYSDQSGIISDVLKIIVQQYYSKDDIANILNNYVKNDDLALMLSDYATKLYVDNKIEALKQELLVRMQNITDDDEGF